MIDAQGNYVPDVTPVTTTNAPVPIVPTNMAIPSPTQIYSASNINQATVAPIAPPDLSNASSIYNYYLNSAGVTAARTAAEADAAALAQAKATARNRQLAIEGNPLESQQFIVGQQSRAGQLDNAALNALADTAGVSSANYASARQLASEQANVALSQRSELVNLITQNPGAKITFNDTVQSATGKIDKYNKKVEKDNQKKVDEEYKKNLKASLIKLGVSNKTKKGGTMSVKAMEKALAAEYKTSADAEKALNNLKLKSAQLDIDKGYKDLNEKDTTELSIDKSDKGLATIIEQARNSGDDWGTIAATLSAAGIGVESGSFADKYLRFKFGESTENPLK